MPVEIVSHKRLRMLILCYGYLSHNCHLAPDELLPFKTRLKRAPNSNVGVLINQKFMNKNFLNKRLTNVLAVAGAALITASAQAYTAGDFVLGFHQTGTNTSIASSFTLSNFTTQQTFDLGTVGSTFSSTFGSGFATDPTVFWGAVATTAGGPVGNQGPDYISRPETVGGSESSSASLPSTLIQNFSNKIQNAGLALASGTAIAGSTMVREDKTAIPNAWQNFLTGGTNDSGHAQGNVDWGFFSGSSTTQANLGLGFAGRTLDIYQLTGSPSTGTDIGDLSLSFNSSTGDLMATFTPDFAEVPEPSTYGMFGLGTLALGGLAILRRRRALLA